MTRREAYARSAATTGEADVDDLTTVDWAPWVFGDEPVPLDDPAEAYHEASSLYPGTVDDRPPGLHFLERSAMMRATTVRAVKRHEHLPTVALPRPRLGRSTLAEAIDRRRSERQFAAEPLPLDAVATLLHAAYGVTHSLEATGQPLRTVPSGGGLYPLELYVAPLRVPELGYSLYHFDPLRRVLERLRPCDTRRELEPLTVYPELFVEAALVLVIAAVFWRTRFKYGQRGYRFALLEAGHISQNLMLTAAALGLAAVPVGGFYDRRVNDFLGLDGVHEAAIYALPVGRAPAST